VSAGLAPAFRRRSRAPREARAGARLLLVGLILLAGVLWVRPGVLAADEPVIAAAADLIYALPEIAEAFSRDTGRKVKLSFGSSGNFARQIAQGAPFQLFLSADERYVRFLAERGHTEGEGALYAIGRIVLFVPHGSSLQPDPDLRDLAAALENGRLRRFAIANPEHAPYGRAAREALIHAGLWERIEPRLVLGENASQATQFATAGAAAGGIVPYSLALAPAVAARGSFVLIPEDRHSPLAQRMVLIAGAGETARALYAYLQQPPAREVLRRYGFLLPEAP
jgi:molybdate transport system substrate-binding protein